MSDTPAWYLGFLCAQANADNFTRDRKWLRDDDSRKFIMKDATHILALTLPECMRDEVVESIAIIDMRVVSHWLKSQDGKLPIWTTHFAGNEKVECNARACAIEIFASCILKKYFCSESCLIQSLSDLRRDLVVDETELSDLIRVRATAYVASLPE